LQVRSSVWLPAAFSGSPATHMRGLLDLVRLVRPLFVATQLDDVCRISTNPSTACLANAQSFPGRCAACKLGRDVMSVKEAKGDRIASEFNDCQELTQDLISDIRSAGGPRRYVWSRTPIHRYEAMRVYATAMTSRSARLLATSRRRCPRRATFPSALAR
jgi:hypothetical protein